MEIFARAAAHLGGRSFGLFVVCIALLVVGINVGAHLVSADPPDTQARIATLAEARLVLGRDVPQVHLTTPGLRLTSVAVDPLSSPNRGVHLTYALANENVVALSFYSADSTDRIGTGDLEKVDLNGEPALVSVKTIEGGQAVTYTWSHGGLANVLHVKLTATLTRGVADQIAASVN